MIDPNDTIVALATPRGGAARGIVRLSGPDAWEIVGTVFDSPLPPATASFRPRAVAGLLSLPSLASPVPATLYLSRSPRSYTGQDLVEVHTLGSPPILDLALFAFLARGARQAIVGEFTMRAFLSGKLDLTAAEAVLGLIDATTPRQAEVALQQMAGGIARPIQRLRDQLLDLLARLEAGLDFAEEDIEFVDRSELRATLETVRSDIDRIATQMRGRATSDDRRRVVLVGQPSVGKSSLFNALLGRDAALVSRVPGTTRDYLVGQLTLGDVTVDLVDTAGIELAADAMGEKAQAMRDEVVAGADLRLCCVDSQAISSWSGSLPLTAASAGDTIVVLTKADLVTSRNGAGRDGGISADLSTQCSVLSTRRDQADKCPELKSRSTHADTAQFRRSHSPLATHHSTSASIPVSSITGVGLAELRLAIADWARGSTGGSFGVVAGTAVRCRQAVAGAASAIGCALAAIDSRSGDELIALELRLALDELAHVVGAVYTDDILDRIFSRFCIGK